MKTADGFDANIGDFVWIKNSVEGRPPTKQQIGEILENRIIYSHPCEQGYEGAKISSVFKLKDRAYWKFIGDISVYVGGSGISKYGDPTCDFGAGYIGSTEKLIEKARELCSLIHYIDTNRPDCVAALQALVRNREINLTIYRFIDDKTWEKYDVDIKGCLLYTSPSPRDS